MVPALAKAKLKAQGIQCLNNTKQLTLSWRLDGNQPTDAPSAARYIDMPASYHNGACGFSFADGHSEIHKWLGSKIGKAPVSYTGTLPLNQPAGDSWMDAHWMAEYSTTR